MSRSLRARPIVACALALLLALGAAAQRPAATSAQSGGPSVLAVTADNQLVRFRGSAPGELSAQLAITGLQVDESIVGIDVRPATGDLYALGSTGRLYTLDTDTGAAALVGTQPFTPTLSGEAFGFDFNPTVDRIRVVSDTGQNLRLNPNDGSVVDADAGTGGVQPDTALSGAATGLVGAGYTNSFAGATATVLYGVDAAADQLVTLASPNGGVSAAVGPLGLDITSAAGFDVAPGSNRAYAALTPAGETNARWYTIDLATGAATAAGDLGVAVRAIALEPPAPDTVYALTNGNRLLSFSSADPGAIRSDVAVTGLQAAEQLLAIDFRPADGMLYGLGSSSRIYRIDERTGAAAVVGTQPFTPTLTGAAFGFDVNPAVDRLRIVSDADENLRVNPSTGAALADGALAYAAGDTNAGANPNVVGAAYTNNISGTGTTTPTTTLLVIDAGLDVLALQNPPNAGTLTTVGELGVDVSGELGFDITPDGVAYVAFSAPVSVTGTLGAGSTFGTIDTATGAITGLGTIGGGAVIRDLAVPTWDTTLFLPVIFKES